MKLIRTSFAPGVSVAIFLDVAAWVFLATHAEAFTSAQSNWKAALVVWATLPALSCVFLVLNSRHWAARLLLVKAMVLFLASVPDLALFPGRWLLFASLVTLCCTALPSRWKTPAAFVAVLEYLSITHVFPDMTRGALDPVVGALALALLVLLGVLMAAIQNAQFRIEVLKARNDELHSSVLQLTSVNTEFLEQANTASEESAVHERHRITRDLHDVVGQTLTNIIMMMDATLHRKVHEPEETVKLLKWIRKQAQDGLEETRSVLYELRALKPTRLRGIKALKKLIETFSRLSRIKTKVEWGNLPWTFAPEQENAVYHLVQGSLSNAFRHGSATQIDLQFQIERGNLLVMIRDNGKGGPDSAFGIGQKGMEERLARWGGSVTFHSEPYGYVVQASMPLQEDPDGPV